MWQRRIKIFQTSDISSSCASETNRFFCTEIVYVFSSLYVYVFSIAGLAFLLLVCLPAAREQMLYIFRGKNVDFLQPVKHLLNYAVVKLV